MSSFLHFKYVKATPLHHASVSGHKQAVEALCGLGAMLDAKRNV
jgi:ankyrin repeat protein